MAFDALLNDPVAQLGYGLLVAGAPGGNMQQGFGAALGLMEQGEQRKLREQEMQRQARQDEMQRKLYDLKVMEAVLPDMQYTVSPVTGEVLGIDKRSGTVTNLPVGQAGMQQPMQQLSGELAMPPLPGAQQPFTLDTSGMTPKMKALVEQKIAEKEIERAFPSPQEQEKLIELEKQKQGKVEMAAETKRLIDEILQDEDAIRSAVGPVSSQLPTVFSSTAEAENKIRRLRNLATAGNLKLMSGVLSESDIQILADLAGGQYDLTRGDEMFINDLKRAQQSMNKTLFNQNAPQPIQSGFSIRRVR